MLGDRQHRASADPPTGISETGRCWGGGTENCRTPKHMIFSFSSCFLLRVGGNVEQVSHCSSSGPQQADRVGGVQLWLCRGCVEASKQSNSQHCSFSPLRCSRAGSARDTRSANVTWKVPGSTLQLGFMDHGCESQAQEHICSIHSIHSLFTVC